MAMGSAVRVDIAIISMRIFIMEGAKRVTPFHVVNAGLIRRIVSTQYSPKSATGVGNRNMHSVLQHTGEHM